MIDLDGELPAEHDFYPQRSFDFLFDQELGEDMRLHMGVQIDWTKESLLRFWKTNFKIEA